jgi:membrane protein implicated in regulation of membrane protease activity
VRDDRLLRGWVFGLWCASGGVAVGALLAYLTNWQIGAVTGLVMGVVLAVGVMPSRATIHTGRDEEPDLAARLQKSVVFSTIKGNRFHSE